MSDKRPAEGASPAPEKIVGLHCVLDPEIDGRYGVWIWDEPYRGIETDVALGSWKRVRVGASWTQRHFVGTYRTRRGSLFAAWRALRKAQRNRQRYEVGQRRARANLDRERIVVQEGTRGR